MSTVPNLPPVRGTLPLVLALALASAYTASTHAAPGNPVQRFDDAVSRGLPQRVALTHDRLSRNTADGMLDIGARVDGVDVTFSDGTTGTHYTATWHGKPAIATRSGDHLDITVTDNGVVDVTGFSQSSDSAHHFQHGTPGAPPTAASRSGAAETQPPSGAQPLHDGVSTVGFYMFVHDEVRHLLDRHIHAGYVAWWVVDMRRLLAVSRVQAVYRRRIAGATNLPTGTPNLLDDFTIATQGLVMREGLIPIPGRAWFKFMLITHEFVAPGISGRAWFKGDHALASMQGPYTVIAHEFGHTLGGTHEDAEVDWSGYWPCETNLYWNANALRANCYRYTPVNQRRMRDYMAGNHAVGGVRRFEMVD